MGVICGIRFTEEIRAQVALALAIIHWISVLGSLALAIIGLYGRKKILPYVELMDTYDDSTLPYLLLGVGLAFAAVQVFGGVVCFLNGDPNKRAERKILFLPYIILTGIMLVCTFAAAIMCFVHIGHLRESFAEGMAVSMDKYRDHKSIKMLIDKLQMDFGCCGSETYTDWFNIAWINEDYLDTKIPAISEKMDEGGYKTDDVPFSCCSPESVRPCIHTDVHDNDKHYNYDYKSKTTLNDVGCKAAMMSYFGSRLSNAGGIVMGVFFLQVAVLVMARFLQTAIETSMADPEGPSQGYLFNIGGEAGPEVPPRPDEAAEYMMPVETPHHEGPEKYQSFSHHTYAEIDDSHFDDHPSYDTLRTQSRVSNKHSQGSLGSIPNFAPPPPPGISGSYVSHSHSPEHVYEEFSDE